MNKKTKKGFTIVELVIVIAVIAILAAVLIPTFSNVIQKAKISKDTQLIRNLNTALAVDGKQHNTMHDAIIAAEAFGYNLEKIDASATDNKILWDSKNDVFCYLVKDGETTGVQYIPDTQLKVAKEDVDDVDYWMIANELPTTPMYSIYAGPQWNDSNLILSRSLEEGFDAGSQSVSEVKYVGTKPVVIRTNNDAAVVTVDNAAAVVNWYGTARKIDVINAAPSSVHVFGTVIGNVEVANGRVVVESSANVSAVVATANEAKIDVISGAECGAVAKTNEVTADIVITGIAAEDVVTIDTTVTGKFAGGLGTEASPYLIANATQFRNIGEMSTLMQNGESLHFNIVADIDLRNETFDAEKPYISYYFKGSLHGTKGGTGNYKILLPDAGLNYLFDQIANVEFSDFTMVEGANLVKLLSGDAQDKVETAVVDNVDYCSANFNSYSYQIEHNGSLYFRYNYSNNLTVGGTHWIGKYVVKNCDVQLNLLGAQSSNSAVFFGAYTYDKHNGSSISVIDCTYEGTFVGNYVALVLSNGQGDVSHLTIEGLTNNGTLIGAGGAYAVGGQNHNQRPASAAYYDSVQATTGGTYRLLSSEGLTATLVDNKLTINNTSISEVKSYEVVLYAVRLVYNASGVQYASNYNYGIKFRIEANGTGSIATEIAKYKFVDYETAITLGLIEEADCDDAWINNERDESGECKYQIVTKDEISYYVFKFDPKPSKDADGNIYKEADRYEIKLQNPTIEVYAFDASDTLLAVTRIDK